VAGEAHRKNWARRLRPVNVEADVCVYVFFSLQGFRLTLLDTPRRNYEFFSYDPDRAGNIDAPTDRAWGGDWCQP
jgi:hypothetical protein